MRLIQKIIRQLLLESKILFFSVLFLCIFHWASKAQSPLCPSAPTTFCCEYISSVNINGVEKTGASGFTGPAGYFDYTGSGIGNLVAGNTYPVSVTVQTNSTYREYVKIWFDFNGNGDLSDAGELVFDQNNSFNGTYTYSGNVLIPTSAFNGDIYIRVIMVFNNTPVLCGSYGYGTTMDLKATITGGVTPRTLTISTTATGGYNGGVSSTPTGINTAGGFGSSRFADGSVVSLTATPAAGGLFLNWSGDASGTSNPLSVTMNVDKNITANFGIPNITSATYNALTGTLAVTGGGFLSLAGANNDIVVSKLTFTGEGGATYTLTSSNVEITSGTSFTVTLNTTDKAAINLIANKNEASSTSGTTYNLAAAEDWAAGADPAVTIADLTGNGVTVSNVAVPAITSATYNANTGALVVTGTGFLSKSGTNNDIVVSKLTFTGEGGATYTLTSSNVEITSGTSFTVTLNTTDKAAINLIANKNEASSTSGTTYNLAAAEDWAAGADPAVTIADLTGNGVTVSNVAVPAITSATYNANTGALVVTGTGFLSKSGTNNDIVVSKLTFTGEGGATYTLTSSNVEITSGTSFTVTLNTTDKAAINLIANKNEASSTSGTTYNLAAAEDWAAGADPAVTIADLTGNGVTVSNVAVPAITSATYNANTGALVVTGTGFLSKSGTNNDIVVSKLTFTGEGGATYTLTSSGVEITSGTSFTVTLNATDKAAINQIANKNEASSTSGTTYNLAAAEDWAAGADPAVTIADLTGNGVTVSNVAVPTITSATYNANTGALVVTGTGFLSKSGTNNDIVVSKLTFTGEGGATYTLTSSNVEITSGTSFTVTLNTTDKAAINLIANKNEASSASGTTYNLAAAEDWAAGADPAVTIADLTGNGIIVSNVIPPPTAGSNTYTYSGTSRTASANVGAGETVDWYAGQTGGSTIVAPSGINAGNYSAYAEARNTTTGSVSPTRTLITLQITAKTLVITPEAGQNKVYGSTDPVFTYTASPSLETGDSFTGALARTAGANAGDYQYNIGSLSAGANYSLSVAAAPKFSITQKTLVITPDAGQNKVYGSTDPVFTYTASPSLETGDSFTGALARTAGANAGDYQYNIGSLSAGTNYSLSVAAAPKFSITQKTLVITPDAGQSKVYGSTDPVFTYTASPSLETGDSFTGALARTAGANAGDYQYNIGSLSAGANYSLSVAAAPKFSITQKTLVITPDAGQNKVYGSTDPVFTYTASPSLETGDSFTGALARTAGANAGDYQYNIGSLSAGTNYSLSVAAAPKFSITQKTLVITPDAGQNKVYGSTDPVFTYTASPSLETGDSFTGALARTAGANAGDYQYNIGSLSAGTNYSLSVAAAPKFSITQKTLVITPDAGQSKVYGSTDPVFTYTASPSLETGDSFTGALARTAGANAGDYQYNIGSLSAGTNYSLSVAAAPKFSITQKTLVITPEAGQNKVYGSTDPVFTYTASPSLETGDSFTGALARTAGANAGDYQYNIGSLSAGTNYSLSVAAAPKFSITQKTLVITPDAGQSKVYGSTDPVFTYTASPSLETGDSFTGALARTAGANAGDYQYNIGSLSAGTNYSLSVAAAPKFSITQKTLVITPEAGQNKVYGSTDPVFTYTASPSLETGDSFTGALARTAGANAGDYQYNIGSLSAGTNYSLSVAAAPKFSITQKTLVITPDAGQSKVYGSTDPVFTYTASPSLETGDSFTGALARTAGANAGDYQYNIGSLSAGANYSLSVAAAPKFSITQKTLVITPEAGQNKVYGSTDPVFTYTASPSLETGDSFTGALARTAGANAGDYQYNIGSLSAGANYSLSVAAAPKFSITQKTLVITPEAGQNKVYGSTDPVFTYTASPSLETGDSFTGALARTAGANAGDYQYNIGSLSAGANYSLSVAAAPKFSITQKTLVITPDAGQSKVYGSTDPVFTYTASPSLETGDSFTGALARTAGANAGDYQYNIGSLSAGTNYSLSVAAAPKFSITQKTLVITPDAGQSKVYGSTDPVFTYTASPSLETGDSFTGALARTAGANAGDYQYNIGSLSAGTNYSLSVAAAPRFSIIRKDLLIRATDKEKCYDGSIYTGSKDLNYSGFANGDDPSTLNGSLSFSGTSATAVNPGSYSIIPSGLTSPNYDISYQNGTLSIYSLPIPTILGLDILCERSNGVSYTTEPGMSGYTWEVSNGGSIISGSSSNTLKVNWDKPGNQSISINYMNSNGCLASSVIKKIVTVNPFPGDGGIISGATVINSGANGIIFSVPPISNATSYDWSFPAGANIISGSGTNSVTVNFDKNASSGIVSVAGMNSCNHGNESTYPITVIQQPGAAGAITGQTIFGRGAIGIVYSVDPIDHATEYIWFLPAGARIVSGDKTNTITVDFGMNAMPGDITVYGSNSAGQGLISPNFKITLREAKFLIYPVPNNGYFTAKVTYPLETPFNIRIMNQMGIKIYEIRGVQTTNGFCEKVIDLGQIPSGKYYMQFFNNHFNEVREILINRN